ncbi:ATP synthase F1 subunit gamma [Blattabacterium cuenoti]|uniref:ATP synthase F1 subunit gamma n=1 Tax=Blattabacterium cuenoti TaxID=1653831 RepID=UPI00163C0A75|nr:ATP synthase F1 subunit gamma [Blattabacterium cuenoti]
MSSNPKDIKRRIISIESVIKTTEAMKMISVVKSKKSKEIFMNIKYYLDHIELIFSELISTLSIEEKIENKYFHSSNGKKLFIVFTSNRGLCGSFNSSIFEKINIILQKKHFSYKNCIFFCIGKKGFDFLSKKYNIYDNLIENFNEKKIKFLINKLISDFFKNTISSIYLVYNSLKDSLLQKIIVEKFLPIKKIKNLYKHKESKNFILEPSKNKIINYIIPKILFIKLKKTFSESLTAEHTARMISMHKATENASHIKNDLILNYNKERQATITKEILEIIGGLDSLQIK